MASGHDNSSHELLPSLVAKDMRMTPLRTAPTVLIRAARGSDGETLERLAALDSASVPAGELLVAESDGAIVAAHAPAVGATIADPFRRTAEIVELLELHAMRLHAGARRRAASSPWLRPRARIA
jgi:hypothetical protein